MDSFGPAQGSLSSGLTAAAFPLLAPNGTAAAPSYSFTSGAGSGMSFDGTNLRLSSDSNVVIIEDGTTAQEFRVYGTTTGPKYAVLSHDGTNVSVGSNSGGGSVLIKHSGNTQLTFDGSDITFINGLNMAFNTSAGTKIGTAATQKIGFWNATPVVQPTTIVDADGTLADITTKFNSLLSKMETCGLLASA